MTFKGHSWEELLTAFNLKIEEPPEVEWTGGGPTPKLQIKFKRSKEGYRLVSFRNGESPQVQAYWEAQHKRDEAIDEAKRKAITDFLDEVYGTDHEEEVFAKLICFLAFLLKQSEQHDYYHPVWRALLQIEDNHTLFQCVGMLLPAMWT